MHEQECHTGNRCLPRTSTLVVLDRHNLAYQRKPVTDPAHLQGTHTTDLVKSQRVPTVAAESEGDPACANQELTGGVETERAIEFGAVVYSAMLESPWIFGDGLHLLLMTVVPVVCDANMTVNPMMRRFR